MDRPSDSQKPGKNAVPPPPQSKDPKSDDGEMVYNLHTLYLVFYNWISAVLWAGVLGRVLLTLATRGYTDVYPAVGGLAKWTQTLAGLEIMHSSFRIVRAPLLTTIMQVSSRFLLVWLIVDKFPHLAISSPAYSTMLLAWSVTEVIRYSYFVGALAYGAAPAALKWCRYNGFVLLYPMGILSEVWLVCLACEPARGLNVNFERGLWAVLIVYAPGSWILFTHMMQQRKKVMQGADKQKKVK